MASHLILIDSKNDKGLSNKNPLHPIYSNKIIYLVNTENREIKHVCAIDKEYANCYISQNNSTTFVKLVFCSEITMKVIIYCTLMIMMSAVPILHVSFLTFESCGGTHYL